MTVKEFLNDHLDSYETLTSDGHKLRSIYNGDMGMIQQVKITMGDIWRVGKHIYLLDERGLTKLTEGDI